MIDKKSYIETILFTAVQAVDPLVERMIYQKYDDPKFRKWEAVYIELEGADEYTTGRTISIDVTGMSLTDIIRAVNNRLDVNIPCEDNEAKPPKAVTSGGYGSCPTCEQLVARKENRCISYCCWCGQLLRWEDENDN